MYCSFWTAVSNLATLAHFHVISASFSKAVLTLVGLMSPAILISYKNPSLELLLFVFNHLIIVIFSICASFFPWARFRKSFIVGYLELNFDDRFKLLHGLFSAENFIKLTLETLRSDGVPRTENKRRMIFKIKGLSRISALLFPVSSLIKDSYSKDSCSKN